MTAPRPRLSPLSLLCAPLALAGALAVGVGSACSPGETAEAASMSPEEIERSIEELADALVEPDATADHNQFLAWKQKRQELIDRLGAGPQALGSALLERVTDERLAELSIPQAKGFLAVMARSHPEAATPRLLELFRTYGHPLDLRQGAARELAVADPRLAIEEYGPLLEMPRPGSTMPGHEFLLEAYLIACENQQEDPTEVLVAITTGILYDSTVRHAAVRALGERPSEMGFHALEQALIESTGNVYLRKLAAQSLIASNPEQACEVLRRVADAEADIGFLEALANLLETHCE